MDRISLPSVARINQLLRTSFKTIPFAKQCWAAAQTQSPEGKENLLERDRFMNAHRIHKIIGYNPKTEGYWHLDWPAFLRDYRSFDRAARLIFSPAGTTEGGHGGELKPIVWIIDGTDVRFFNDYAKERFGFVATGSFLDGEIRRASKELFLTSMGLGAAWTLDLSKQAQFVKGELKVVCEFTQTSKTLRPYKMVIPTYIEVD